MKHAIVYILAGVCATIAILLPTPEEPAWVLMWLLAILFLTFAAIEEKGKF